MFGSDEEKAIRGAIAKSFPQSSIVGCVRHLKKNLDNLMIDKVGLPKTERKRIIHDLFSPDGEMNMTGDPQEGEEVIEEQGSDEGKEKESAPSVD